MPIGLRPYPFRSPEAILDEFYRNQIAQPTTSLTSQAISGLSGGMVPQGVSQGTARFIVPQSLQELEMQMAFPGASKAMSPARWLSREAAQRFFPRAKLFAGRVAIPAGVGYAQEGQEGAIRGGAAALGGEVVGGTVGLGSRLIGKRAADKKSFELFSSVVTDSVEAWKGQQLGSPRDLAEFLTGRITGSGLTQAEAQAKLSRWYGDQLKKAGAEIHAAYAATLPPGIKLKQPLFNPEIAIPDFKQVIGSIRPLRKAGYDAPGRLLTWDELNNVMSEVGKKAWSPVDRKTIVGGKETNLKDFWDDLHEYLTTQATAISPASQRTLAHAREQYKAGEGLWDLFLDSKAVSSGRAGYEYDSSRILQHLSDVSKGSPILERLGPAAEGVMEAAARGGERGMTDVSGPFPIGAWARFGNIGRLSERLQLPGLAGYPYRPYDYPATRAILGMAAERVGERRATKEDLPLTRQIGRDTVPLGAVPYDYKTPLKFHETIIRSETSGMRYVVPLSSLEALQPSQKP